MRLTRVALGTVTLGLMTAVAATALETTDSARAALFEVTAPDSAVTWTAGRFQTVTWNVAGSKAAPVNAANVRISLSVDGGETFPLVLAAATANDGSESVAVPSATTSRARLKVEAVANRFFFDVNDADFTIVGGTGPDASVGDVSVVEGNTGTTPVGVPGHPVGRSAHAGHRRLHDGARHRHGARRLRDHGRHADVRSRRDDAHRHADRRGRRDGRRGGRELLPEHLQPVRRRHHRRRAGRRSRSSNDDGAAGLSVADASTHRGQLRRDDAHSTRSR